MHTTATDTIALISAASAITGITKTLIHSNERASNVLPIRYIIFALLIERGHGPTAIATAFLRTKSQIQWGIKKHQNYLVYPTHAKLTSDIRNKAQ